MTLPELMVALAVSGIVVIAIASTNRFLSSTQAEISNDLDLLQIKQDLKAFVDCKQSIAAARISGLGSAAPLLKTNGAPLYAKENAPGPFFATFSAGNSWYLKTKYTGSSIEVRAGKRIGKRFAKGHIDGLALDFTNPSNLLFSESLGASRLCEADIPSQAFEIDRYIVKNSELYPIMGLAGNLPHGDRYWQNSMRYQKGCNDYCRLHQYETGIAGDMSDINEIWQDGVFVRSEMWPPGESKTVCICFN